MEEELLEQMIRDREIQLNMIRKKMEDQSQKLERLRTSLDDTKKKYAANHLEQQMEVETLLQRRSKLLLQYKEAKEALDMKKQQQGPQLHIYNEIMKSLNAPENNNNNNNNDAPDSRQQQPQQDSSYVTRMQAQLCKAMHSMGMVETQLAMNKSQVEGLQKFLRESKTSLLEEKTQVELKLMNDLVGADNLRKEVAEKVQKQTEEFTKQKDALIEKMELQKEHENSDGEPEDDDDAEEKAELTEILTEGREEILRMEKENKEELEKLEALKQKVIAIKGEKLVEELCAQLEEEFKEKLQEGEEEEEEEEAE
eukprot:scaffold1736_cov127-Cylindrotheca_fusiformis.AAC.70